MRSHLRVWHPEIFGLINDGTVPAPDRKAVKAKPLKG
jgi:hypothetical protein